MIPMADLFNFNPAKMNTLWTFDHEKKFFNITAAMDINKGDEVNLYF
jgi:hypothetical protein